VSDPFVLDLTDTEALRRHHMHTVIGYTTADFDAEDTARALLYGGLDDEQQAIYDRLVEAGVLPGGLQT
jgi:hypothetical protein